MENESAKRWRRLLESSLGVPFTMSNEVKVLRNGVEIFPAMLRAIDQARDTIDFLTFVYWTGDIAERFGESLRQAAERGVKTKVILDSFGAHQIDRKLVERMKRSGVQVVWFRPIRFLPIGRSSHRTHRKILICDNEVGFTGGVGIAEEWTGDAENPGAWRDTHFELRGEALYGLEAAFLGNWLEAASRNLGPERKPVAESQGSTAVQVIRSSATIGWSNVATCFQAMLQGAKRRVRIATPYFVPDENFLELLAALAKKDVSVEVLLPGPHMDKRISRFGAQDQYDRLLEAGVKIWQYQTSMYHAKITTVDGELACIGSANFNRRSMSKDDEIIVNILDREIVGILDQQFGGDIEKSREVELRTWRKRSLLRRALERMTVPFQSEM